jgi:probable HAF family extracellular repeat protein
LGGSVSKANDINRSGQVVGWSLTAGDREARATLWNGTGAVDLNALLDSAVVNEGWLLVDAAGINDRGWIVADAKNTRSGQYSAFLLSPVPEPGNLVLMLVGSAALVIVARRRRCRHLRSRGQATQLQRFADSPRSTIPQWADPMT